MLKLASNFQLTSRLRPAESTPHDYDSMLKKTGHPRFGSQCLATFWRDWTHFLVQSVAGPMSIMTQAWTLRMA